MSQAHRVLGLEPGCSPADVRAAYARLLKQHRPDVDPEGFRRIREAYELLRDGASRGGAPGPADLPFSIRAAFHAGTAPAADATHGTGQEGADPHRADPHRRPPRPPLAQRWLRALARTRARGQPGAMARLQRRLVQCHRSNRTTHAAISIVLTAELEYDGPGVRALLEPADAVLAVRNGHVGLAEGMAREALHAGDAAGLTRLLAALEAEFRRSTTEAGAVATMGVAKWSALIDANRAEAAADLLFGCGMRARDFDDLDRWILAGNEVTRASLEERVLWSRLLHDDDPAADPEALDRAARSLALRHGSAPVLEGMFLAHVQDFGERLHRARRTAVVRSRRREAEHRLSMVPPIVAIGAIMALCGIVRACMGGAPWQH